MTDHRYYDFKTTNRGRPFYRATPYTTNFAAQQRPAALLMTLHTVFWRCKLAVQGLQLVWVADDLYEIRIAPKELRADNAR